MTDRRAGWSTLQPDKKISHTLVALGEEKINISTISSGQESHAPQDGFRWIPEFLTSWVHTFCVYLWTHMLCVNPYVTGGQGPGGESQDWWTFKEECVETAAAHVIGEMVGRWGLPKGCTAVQQSRGLEQESARMEPIN